MQSRYGWYKSFFSLGSGPMIQFRDIGPIFSYIIIPLIIFVCMDKQLIVWEI